MITDKDINKLKEAFATKDDLKQFATRAEFQELKKEVQELKGKANNVEEGVVTIIEMLGEMRQERDKDSKQIEEQGVILNDHERRIERLESTQKVN